MKQCWMDYLVNISFGNRCVLKGTAQQLNLEEHTSQTEIGTVCAVINYLKCPLFAALCVCTVKQMCLLKCSITEAGR